MKFIINADDFGRTETVNEAITYGFDNHYLDRTTVMVNMPFFEQAVKMAEDHEFKDKVGLHLNLTSGYPLTDDIKRLPTFCGKEGWFNGAFFYYRRMQFILNDCERKAVKKEIEAQINKYFEYGFSLLHADSHGHIHTFPSMQKMVLSMLKKNGFQSVRMSTNVSEKFTYSIRKWIQNIEINRFNTKGNCRVDYFGSFDDIIESKNLLSYHNKTCEIMLHPNIYNGDMQIGQAKHYDDLKQIY